MSELVLVDTDIVIDAGRSVREAITCLTHIERRSSLAVSTVTQMELLVGCRSKAEQRNIERFLQRFAII